LLLVLLLALGLTACGKGKEKSAEDDAAAGQVVAIVDGQEVTIHELDAERQAQRVPPNDKAAVPRLLKSIVDRKLFLAKAIAAGADRQPSALLSIRRLREDLLANTYLRQRLAEYPPVSRHDIDAFILANPTMFADRQVFVLDEIVLPPANVTDDLAGYTKDAQSLEAVADLLKMRDIPNQRQVVVVSSGDAPTDLLDRLTSGRGTDIIFLHTATGAVFFKLIATRSVPIAGDEAIGLARQILTNRNVIKEVVEIQAGLAAAAKIEYVGDYAAIMATPAANPGTP
jgi:EpsD family peptidyl-prolyl cis-trans isomerase